MVAHGGLLARRLIGFGSLGTFEGRCRSRVAAVHRRPVDTRLAIHPADMNCAASKEAVRRTLRRLVPRLAPMNYAAYLRRREMAGAEHRVAAH